MPFDHPSSLIKYIFLFLLVTTKKMSIEKNQKSQKKFFKIVQELSVFDGVEIAAVFYNDCHKKPIVYPDYVGAIKTFEKFKKLPMREQFETSGTIGEILQQLINEKKEQLRKLTEENNRKEMLIQLHNMKGKFSIDMIKLEDLSDWMHVMREYIKELKERMKAKKAEEEATTSNI